MRLRCAAGRVVEVSVVVVGLFLSFGGVSGKFEDRKGCVSRDFEDPPVAARVVNDVLVDRRATRVVRAFNGTDASRYFSVYEVGRGGSGADGAFPSRCGERRGEVWVIGKRGEYPNANRESWTVLWSDCDAGLRACAPGGDAGGGGCFGRAPRTIHANQRIDHNLGCLLGGAGLSCVGGMLKTEDMATTALAAASRDALEGRGLRRVKDASGNDVPGFTSRLSGCVDLRRQNYPKCEFDGRFSLARFASGRTLLYARANMAPEGGGRYVTVAEIDGTTMAPRAPMEMIRFLPRSTTATKLRLWGAFDDAFDVLSDLARSAALANIYFPTVNANPVDGGKTLLGLFPTSVEIPSLAEAEGELFDKYPERGAMLLAVSVDGVRFSPPVALVSAFPNGGEINDHAVDGLVERGDAIFFYVHAGVPGTLAHLCPRFRPTGDAKPTSRLVRYALRRRSLLRYTRDAVARLRAAPPDDAYHVNASGIFTTPVDGRSRG